MARPKGSKNKPKAGNNFVTTNAKPKDQNMSPWLNEISDLNQEVNALRNQLHHYEAIIKYLEQKLGLDHEDFAI